MRLNRLYYRIKPLVPSPVRVAIRRWFALRKRDQVRDVWPILQGSERPPANWTGWPDGNAFALVLTHDVEGPEGLAKCTQLMELEMKLGFRSSFNFIPEGGYEVPRPLIDQLKANGFEIGVHDLQHDGKLYHSRKDFAPKAVRINQRLKAWGAVGFRSGFMLHNLEWLHDLDVTYDASTFDTDPFEPQPDGVGTIFPFWVPNPNLNRNSNPELQPSKSGYVELPYTLPQDSTLFLVFRERNPDIWFQKLDWIAKYSGMALLNVHPDYIRFEGERFSPKTYPVEFYTLLLQYVRQRYNQACWQPLPKVAAAFAAQVRPAPRLRPKRICMVAYSHYNTDARVTRYAEALAGRGDHVDVVALQESPDLPARETVANVNLIRIQPRFGKNEQSRLSYLVPVLRFLFTSVFWIARQHARNRYDLFHVHNVPDFLVVAAAWPRLTGAKVILDIHDIVPEFYASKFGELPNSKTVFMLKLIERVSARIADHVIIGNHLWLEKYSTRTGANGKCSVFINNVESQIFQRRPRTRNDGRFIVLFPGGLQRHQGLDIAIRAFQKVSAELPNAEFHIYGEGNVKESLITLSNELGLDGKVRFFNPLPVRQVAEIMANADLGVVPKRADSFGNEAYSTKIMEFMSLGIPVVVSKTKIDQYYFDDAVVRFFESGNSDALAEAILGIACDPVSRQRMVAHAFQYAALNSWESRKADYLNLVDSLISGDKAGMNNQPPAGDSSASNHNSPSRSAGDAGWREKAKSESDGGKTC